MNASLCFLYASVACLSHSSISHFHFFNLMGEFDIYFCHYYGSLKGLQVCELGTLPYISNETSLTLLYTLILEIYGGFSRRP